MSQTNATPNDILAVLPDEARLRLIAHWREKSDEMVETAATVASGGFPQVGQLITHVASYLYKETPVALKSPVAKNETSSLEPKDRERCLIAIFTSTDREGYGLPIHVYWGLMEGLTVRDIADTIALAGAYAGLPVYINGMERLKSTLEFLVYLNKNQQKPEDLSPKRVAGRIRAHFAITPPPPPAA